MPRKILDTQHLLQALPEVVRSHEIETEEYKIEQRWPTADCDAINKGLCDPIYDLLDRGGK